MFLCVQWNIAHAVVRSHLEKPTKTLLRSFGSLVVPVYYSGLNNKCELVSNHNLKYTYRIVLQVQSDTEESSANEFAVRPISATSTYSFKAPSRKETGHNGEAPPEVILGIETQCGAIYSSVSLISPDPIWSCVRFKALGSALKFIETFWNLFLFWIEPNFKSISPRFNNCVFLLFRTNLTTEPFPSLKFSIDTPY